MSDQGLNLKFVGEVEKHEELYNYKLPGYSRKEVIENAWQEVAAKVNISGMTINSVIYYYKVFYQIYAKCDVVGAIDSDYVLIMAVV